MIVLSFSHLLAGAVDFNPDDYRHVTMTAARLDNPLRIDAVLNEPLYDLPSFQTFIQLDPDNGELASEKTEVWVGYDDAALYIGARLWDESPDSIVGRMGRRDEDTNSDQFQVAVDSYHDKRSGFFFIVNPSGAIMDGTISNDSWFDETWDGIWEAKTSIDDGGWTVEMRIPFSQLRFGRQDEYTWGLGIGRVIQRRREQSLNTYIPRGESGLVSHFATLQGISHVQPPSRLEILPYVTGGYASLPSRETNPFFNGRDITRAAGADLKVGLGSNLTVDATFNPDFGQVEVDPSVINLTDYETFYQEKRPFFVEGAGIFSFGRGGPTNRWGFNFSEPGFFYSRRIGRPPQGPVNTTGWTDIPAATTILGAAKISGKINGDWSVGAVSAVTDREYARVREDGKVTRHEVEPLTSYNLIRTQKEFNRGLQGLGLVGTAVFRSFKNTGLRDVLSDRALALGVDGWTFISDRNWVVSGWGGFTRVEGSEARMTSLQHTSGHYFQRPDAGHVTVDSTLTAMNGFAGRLVVNKEKGHVLFNSALGIISPGFESNDLGISFRTDVINKHLVAGYRWYDPGEVFRSAMINAAYMSNHDFEGVKTSEMVFVFGYAQLLNYWSFNGFSGWGPRTLSDTKLRGGPRVISPSGGFGKVGVSSDNRKNIIFGAEVRGGRREKGGRSWGVSGSVEIKMGTRFNASIEPGFSVSRTVDQYVTRFEDETAHHTYGVRYILARIDQKTLSADIRLNYTLTPTLSLQAYFQPFVAVGHYSRFKEFKWPRTYDFVVYGENGTSITEEDGGYLLDPTGGNDDDSFFVADPDFNYKALVGNAVLRWEFLPGSTLYLVWTRNGYDFRNPGNFRFRRDFAHLLNATTDNVFAVKIAYWISP
ncbi:MAG: DUF5916 domain-containing protein [Fidelibacterota bacterium]